MTPAQVELARHALGLRSGTTCSFRNFFCAGPGHPDYAEWQAMVADGHATRRTSKHHGGDDLFHLTREGAQSALRPGERLCPEDFPPAVLP